MTTEERKKILSKILSAFLVIMIFLGGIFIGRQSNAGTQMTSGDLLSVSENKDLNQFWKVWKLLNDKYPFKDKIPSDDDRL
mgnify:FL=1